MNLRTLDLNLLPVLEAIYSERSLTRASESLHITQPAVSNALARLRTHFEDPLFVREGRGVKPTAMAEALMPAVRDALDRLRAGLEPRSAFAPARSTRVFNIAARDAGAYILAPALARRLEAEAPGVRIAWSQAQRAAISTELASGRLDLALDVPDLRGADMERQDLFTTPYACFVSRTHPLARKTLTLEQFLGLRHIAVSSRREGRSLVEEVARTAGRRLTPVLRLPHHLPALEVVRQTQLALFAPKPLANQPGIVMLDLPFALPSLGSVLYWRRENSEDPALTWLRGVLVEISKALDAGEA
ncbi:MAG: LysR family transcriptional regulator [Hyphomonas sp.]|uniref:LysR family transcriptional regulator n=1 Tax=Hyphomonas sp. TaxID=87 RepID=UPI001804D6FE|nr:LysR family transcriptional regulator [Hyphomonas sp.]MBU3920212.1 LysR family transcriptional regulator [Alphaproteobacteria bacterium]MBA3069583.1 LysR family transcriptional regulator [Hyphomonas sp.]MBU4063256.1 LysR family transcriptional regulator [Alphaproteobacteria bacterium]MBU4164074.1 LysR family transcriptional regulator [Alphaproteobacteria bacterium]MBU4569080.1 LysR family transcriptional regulator [Alphaproteobacteria bacterium]